MSSSDEIIRYAVEFVFMFGLTGIVTRIIKVILRRGFKTGHDTTAVMTFVLGNIVYFGLLLKGRNVGFLFQATDAIDELALVTWLILDWTVLARKNKVTSPPESTEKSKGSPHE